MASSENSGIQTLRSPTGESDEEEFQDAQASFPDGIEEPLKQSDRPSSGASVSVAEGNEAIQTAVDLMNNNQYREAVRLLKPQAEVSMYHAMAHASVLFLQAAFSMDQEMIEKASEALNTTVTLCTACRRQRGVMESLSGWVFGQRLDDLTDEELQAEILYAEANLLISFLTFLQDESLMSFVKGGLRIRNCFSLFKQLYQWLKTCEEEGIEVEPNFASGVRMGIGCFNLFLSILPPRVLRLLEFVGFSGEQTLGLQELEKGASSGTFRAPLCTSFLLFYYTVALVMLGIGDMDPDHAESLLKPQLDKYPDSVQFLYFKGRVELMRGQIDEATATFEHAIEVQQQWRKLHHICWWELYWCHSFKGEWHVAGVYSDKLFLESRWSKATSLYMTACAHLMLRNHTHTPAVQQPTSSEESGEDTSSNTGPAVASDEQLSDMMRKIPPLKQRIAGKSIPIEKFAVMKSERYLNGDTLPLCGLELLYTHNAYPIISKNPALLRSMLSNVWNQLITMEDKKDAGHLDDWVVVTLLQGVCFKGLQRYDEAEMCFKNILQQTDRVQHDTYAIAAASLELGLLYIETGSLDEAHQILESTKTNYKGYHLESRIHFRLHHGQCKLTQLKAEKQ